MQGQKNRKIVYGAANTHGAKIDFDNDLSAVFVDTFLDFGNKCVISSNQQIIMLIIVLAINSAGSKAV